MNPLLQSLIEGRPLEGLPSSSPNTALPRVPVAKLSYNHEAMIDILIREPWISQNELADRFGMSASWISTIICSDLFQSKLAERREALVDPEIRMSIKTQFEGLLSRSLEVLRAKMDASPDKIADQLALQTAKMTSQSLGMGVRESKINSTEVHVHLEELGNNLVGLLRRRKADAGRIIDGEVSPS